jgi:hypothetical protein
MQESKIVATNRLVREGRWEEASAFRDRVRAQLRAEGKNRRQAAEEAWQAMLEAFPPDTAPATAVDSPSTDNTNTDEMIPQSVVDGSPDFVGDILWVYSNLEAKRVTFADAPTPGAWNLLKWAREYRNRFFEQLVPKAIASKQQQESEANPYADDPMSIQQIRNMIAQAVKPPRERIAADVGTIIDGWSERFAVELGPGAKDNLAASIVGLIERRLTGKRPPCRKVAGRS